MESLAALVARFLGIVIGNVIKECGPTMIAFARECLRDTAEDAAPDPARARLEQQIREARAKGLTP